MSNPETPKKRKRTVKKKVTPAEPILELNKEALEQSNTELKESQEISDEVILREALNRGERLAQKEAILENIGWAKTKRDLLLGATKKKVTTLRELEGGLQGKVDEILVDPGKDPMEMLPEDLDTSSENLSHFL